MYGETKNSSRRKRFSEGFSEIHELGQRDSGNDNEGQKTTEIQGMIKGVQGMRQIQRGCFCSFLSNVVEDLSEKEEGKSRLGFLVF
jgi:hypothetical protein